MSIQEKTTKDLGFVSRLPEIGTTIFSTMSALANQHQAINLGQGFPDFDCDPALITCVTEAMQAGHNQYPLMSGVQELRHAIAQKVRTLYGHEYDENAEITITAGATQAIFTAILSCVHPGDEVIILEPAYDSYLPAVSLAGGKVVPISLTIQEDESGAISFSIPFDRIEAAITPKTRLLIINTPHNPTGTIWSDGDMQQLATILVGTQVLLCSDEVYEHMVYDRKQHASVARYPDLASRSFVISSFGKTYHTTGWKIGYICAPDWLMAEFRKVHQFNVFTVNSPMQYGIAHFMQNSDPYTNLPSFYQHKRDYFRAGLAKTRFTLLPCEGTYFQCVNYRNLGIEAAALPEKEFAEWLTKEIGVAAIPLFAFYTSPANTGIIRFCFAKKDETLDAALLRLQKL